MAIRQLSLNDFRNLKSVTLDFDQHYNVIFGKNGSGKTSLLESISILCQGKSYNTHYLNQCIQHGKKNFLLFAKFSDYQAGFSRNINNSTIRIDGTNISRISQLVEKSPIVSIDSKCFDLLMGPPGNRRAYIDWCLFHVEHPYRELWKQYSHGLKQKNALLKKRRGTRELDYWDSYLSELCVSIAQYREKYLMVLTDIIQELTEQLDYHQDLVLTYSPGWKYKSTPIESFRNNRVKDLKYGFASTGSHRDSIEIKIDDIAVQESASRGQIKKLAIIFYLAQIILIKTYTKKPVIVLVDDLESELDDDSANSITKLLSSLDIQVFITNIRNRTYLTTMAEEYKMFHVEHGMIRPVKNT